MALAVAKLADSIVRGRIASLEDRQGSWPYPARRRIFCATERDVHQSSMRALMLPELPADARRALGAGSDAAKLQIARRDLIRTDVLELHRG